MCPFGVELHISYFEWFILFFVSELGLAYDPLILVQLLNESVEVVKLAVFGKFSGLLELISLNLGYKLEFVQEFFGDGVVFDVLLFL